MLTNIIVLSIIVGLMALATLKIVSDKKKGIKCSGCPHAKVSSTGGCSCPSQGANHQ